MYSVSVCRGCWILNSYNSSNGALLYKPLRWGLSNKIIKNNVSYTLIVKRSAFLETRPLPGCYNAMFDFRREYKKVYASTTTDYRSKIKPSPKLSSNIHYQNYGHQGLFPVITSRSARYWVAIGQFFVPWEYWPIGGQAQAEGLCVGVTQRDTNLGSPSLGLGILDSHFRKFWRILNWINSQIKLDLTSLLEWLRAKTKKYQHSVLGWYVWPDLTWPCQL